MGTMITTIGWVGATLVLLSYAQTNTARLRQINLLASVAMLTFNIAMRIWPSVVLELLLGVVNARRLLQLRSRPVAAPIEQPQASRAFAIAA
jgi:hypothetical protein